MYIIAELAGVITEMLLGHLYLKGFFSKENTPWWVIGSAYTIAGMVVACLSFIPNASFLRLFVFAGLFFLIGRCLFSATVTQAFFASVGFCCLNVLNEMLIFGLFSLFHIDAQVITSYGDSRAASILISHIMLWMCVLIVLAITKKKRSAITLPFLLSLAPGHIAGIALGLSFCRHVLSGDDHMSTPVLASAIGLLYLNILIILYAEQAQRASDQKLQMELAEHHYAMQEQYYDQLRSEQEETRAMFHDINKYMQAMRAVASKCNASEANHILEETQKLFDSLGTVVDVGNSVVSVILNEYKSSADDMDIPLYFNVSVPNNLAITAVDLYVLLGNTLDNAIEACCSVPKEQRYIKLQLKTHRSILFYQIENPFSTDYPQKQKRKNHGYGLQNVRRCVEKHNGHMSISQDGNIFVLSMRINDCIPIDCKLLEGDHFSA